MSVFLPDKDRRVIPRWRDFGTTVATGELDGVPLETPRHPGDSSFFAGKVLAWEADKSVEHAADLVAAGIVLGAEEKVVDAARFILNPDSGATPAVRAIASKVVGSHEDRVEPGRFTVEPEAIDEEVIRLRVRALRGELHDSPRNSMLWVDVARAYAMLGQVARSVKAMDIALKLTPTNRFVLRSAARLFVHVDEPDRAHELLRLSHATKEDPWLLAAEIAVASVAGRNSSFIRRARGVLGSASQPPSQTAELASALGTVELTTGAVKRARRLFRQSLNEPTENTVAQAEWASKKMTGLEVGPELLRVPRSFEAGALVGFRSGNWQEAIRQCENWLLDEQYSSRPAEMGSYMACVVEEDFRLAEQFARRGLLANPEDTMLLNNLVVSLANQGRLSEAENYFGKIGRPGVDRARETTLVATQGLLHFRAGELQLGRALYRRAIESTDKGSPQRALAALHLAREEILANTGEAPGALNAAAAECQASSVRERPDIQTMLAMLTARRPGSTK